MSSPNPFKVTLGVTGGIAAYKAAELVRALQQHALDVHVVMTRAAEELPPAPITRTRKPRRWDAPASGI